MSFSVVVSIDSLKKEGVGTSSILCGISGEKLIDDENDHNDEIMTSMD